MAFEIKKVEKFAVGTVRKPAYQVYDKGGFTDFNMSDAVFALRNSETNAIVDSGSCTIDNSDQDVAGNTIKTVQPTLNLTGTDLEAGPHVMTITVTFTNAETDRFLIPIEIVEYREV
jgi:hypothetical protein